MQIMAAHARKLCSERHLIELKLVLETGTIALIEAKILLGWGSAQKIEADSGK